MHNAFPCIVISYILLLDLKRSVGVVTSLAPAACTQMNGLLLRHHRPIAARRQRILDPSSPTPHMICPTRCRSQVQHFAESSGCTSSLASAAGPAFSSDVCFAACATAGRLGPPYRSSHHPTVPTARSSRMHLAERSPGCIYLPSRPGGCLTCCYPCVKYRFNVSPAAVLCYVLLALSQTSCPPPKQLFPQLTPTHLIHV